MSNRYEKVEIKDYYSICDFLNDFSGRCNLIGENCYSCLIFGSEESIRVCLTELSDEYDYKFGLIRMCNPNVSQYVLEVIRNEQYGFIMNVKPVDEYGCMKGLYFGRNNSKSFLFQEEVCQQLVEKCIDDNDEVMIFGLSKDDGYCSGCKNCVWRDECLVL